MATYLINHLRIPGAPREELRGDRYLTHTTFAVFAITRLASPMLPA